MKRIFAFLILALSSAGVALAQSPLSSAALPPAEDTAVRKKIEAYLRNLYAWGPDVQLAIGPLRDNGAGGLLETTANVVMGEQKDSARIFVSRDGRYMFRGEMSDLSKDPLAEVRAKIQLNDAPSKGDPNAPITIVEFADFQCPVCRHLHDLLRTILPNYPQVRLVFKDYPLSTIHPWARTAALASRCAFRQGPKNFWSFYDKIYDDQQLISPENAWAKMVDYARQAGLNQEDFKACLASPEAAKAVEESFANGQLLEITSTPTLFVNGRRLVGADQQLLEQSLRYELHLKNTATPATKP